MKMNVIWGLRDEKQEESGEVATENREGRTSEKPREENTSVWMK